MTTLFTDQNALLLFQILAVLPFVHGGSPHFVYREEWHERACGDVLARVRSRMVSSSHPPDLQGDWVSSRCEIRSGPEYVLRHFTFNNKTFESTMYHYADPDCNQPLYAIKSHGSHTIQQASWTVQGATEASYEVMTAYLIPYTKNASHMLAKKLETGCQDQHAMSAMKTYSNYLIYKLPPLKAKLNDEKHSPKIKEEKDCFKALHFSLHELQLVLVELRKHHDTQQRHQHHHHRHRHHPHQTSPTNSTSEQSELLAKPIEAPYEQGLTRELLLGAVHSRPYQRQTHRPSSFQTSLKDATTPGCGICSKIVSSNPFYPPRLSTHTGTLLSLEGEWVSTRCESRQYGMFLTRWLHFLSDETSWQGSYDYYHDATCRQPSFSLKAKGSYMGGVSSKLVHGAKDYSFKVTRLKVTPHDQQTVNSLNHYDGNGCGKAHAWAVGKEQDVTWTGGCVTLGIRLPNMERDIMKMEIVHRKLHLYVGQRLVDRKTDVPYQHERPTAFQEPLVKCDQTDLDMSVNTAPGGHSWAGGVALPLASGPEDWSLVSKNAGVGHHGFTNAWFSIMLAACHYILWCLAV